MVRVVSILIGHRSRCKVNQHPLSNTVRMLSFKTRYNLMTYYSSGSVSSPWRQYIRTTLLNPNRDRHRFRPLWDLPIRRTLSRSHLLMVCTGDLSYHQYKLILSSFQLLSIFFLVLRKIFINIFFTFYMPLSDSADQISERDYAAYSME
jgi:hypothetical protein